MVRRAAKRRARQVFIVALAAAFFCVALVFTIFALRSIVPLLRTSSKNQTMIKPAVAMTEASDLQKKLGENNIMLDSFSATTSSGMIAKVKDGPTVFFSQDLPADWQVSSLQLILTRLTIDNKKPKVIDLRQARPIVKF